MTPARLHSRLLRIAQSFSNRDLAAHLSTLYFENAQPVSEHEVKWWRAGKLPGKERWSQLESFVVAREFRNRPKSKKAKP